MFWSTDAISSNSYKFLDLFMVSFSSLFKKSVRKILIKLCHHATQVCNALSGAVSKVGIFSVENTAKEVREYVHKNELILI